MHLQGCPKPQEPPPVITSAWAISSVSCYCPSLQSSLYQYFIRGLLIALRYRWCFAFGGFLMTSSDAIFRRRAKECLGACVVEMITWIFSGPSNHTGKERIGQVWITPAFKVALFEMNRLPRCSETAKKIISRRYLCQRKKEEIIKAFQAMTSKWRKKNKAHFLDIPRRGTSKINTDNGSESRTRSRFRARLRGWASQPRRQHKDFYRSQRPPVRHSSECL